MKFNSIEPGDFKELSTGMCLFSRNNPFPLLPYFCPVCGKQTKNGDNIYLVRYGICSICCSWWEDQIKTCPELKFSDKLEKFHIWVEKEKINRENEHYGKWP